MGNALLPFALWQRAIRERNALQGGGPSRHVLHRRQQDIGYERLIGVVHHGVMALTPEQHAQLAEVYDKAAADHMVPAPQRRAFARRAAMFRILARLGAKPKSAPPPKASAAKPADTLTNPILARLGAKPKPAPPPKASAGKPADTLTNPGMLSAARNLFAWQQRR